jgi:hypothetical protein
MIDHALQFTVSCLNKYLQNRMDVEGEYAVLDKLINFDGSAIASNQNKLIVSLINLERETAQPFYSRHQQTSQAHAVISPDIRLNADILIASNFENYVETLSFLNTAIAFFQTNPVIDSSVSAIFPAELAKLEFEMERLNYHQMHSLWTSMGAKYIPSVIYKMRMLTIQSNQIKGFTQSVTQPNTELS